jgi:hypothetical protein
MPPGTSGTPVLFIGEIGVAARAAGDTCVFKHTPKIDASEIAELNRNQTSNRPKERFRKSTSNHHRETFNQDEGHHGQQSPDREDGSHPYAHEKVNCDCGYQLDPPAEAPPSRLAKRG